jgi:hypothetical protein
VGKRTPAVATGDHAGSVSSPFIHRPIATSLLRVAVMLGACSVISGTGLLAAWSVPHHPGATQLPGASPWSWPRW